MSTQPPVLDVPEWFQSSQVKDALDDVFEVNFSVAPSFYIRCPGRVNLIGEHIDYSGFAVLPMAIEQCILMAVGEAKDASEPSITLINTDTSYERHFCHLKDLKVDKSRPKWYNYVLAGFFGVREHLKLECPKSMCFVVSGTIPPSAGLSSSSALVCAAALATVHINGFSIPKLELASLCARSERYVGTEGGGMDQAICFLAGEGTAKLIEFNPLKASDVHLPSGYVFVIANSLADVNKAATSQYNTRVVECRLASMVLAKHLGLDPFELKTLGRLQAALNVDSQTMAQKVHEHLHVEAYGRSEIRTLFELGSNDERFAELCLNQNTLHLQEFKLHQRALHVYTESQRVRDFVRTCDEGKVDAVHKLGHLMNQSHESCRDLYECSHQDLDELVLLAAKSGALGSRLTGAGWGGCCVSLVPEDAVNGFLDKLRDGYYSKSEARNDRMVNSLFRTAPGNGAAIYIPKIVHEVVEANGFNKAKH